MRLRTATENDRHELAELIYLSTNFWYQTHGHPPTFSGGPQVADVFFEVYNALEPGCTVVAENPDNGRLMGSCFYHPRAHHVALGIMNVHPNYFGRGVASALLKYIVDFTDRGGFKALRLTQSAMNLDSFSLYTRQGFVPRLAYQDMVIPVPQAGWQAKAPAMDNVRDATLADVDAMAALEMAISGITREPDYRYCIDNRAGYWHTLVFENEQGGIDGFMISCGHPAMNVLGPCLAKSEKEALALIFCALDAYRGRTPLAIVPVERSTLVRKLYDWGARNCELHLCQVRGEFQPFRGISMPTFLPETA